jgi:hypothetical protein
MEALSPRSLALTVIATLAAWLTCSIVLLAQNISSSVSGTVIDSSGAPIPGAECILKNEANGVILNAQSDTSGTFTFPTVFAGTYTLTVRAAGFNALELKNIPVTSSEFRALGKISLQIGDLRESVSVTADQDSVQLMSAERSGTVTGAQLNNIALKGRDFFAFLSTNQIDPNFGAYASARSPRMIQLSLRVIF